MEIRKSSRKAAKIRIALQGPSGSGKTYSSILLAKGLGSMLSKTVVIDTENHSADLYSHLGDYYNIALSAPFTPERYIEAIDLAESHGAEVIIIDSISHEWEGEGGILNTHGKMTGNSFANWAKVTPRHNAFVQRMLSSNAHIIATVRSKQDYVLAEKNGKMVPEKVGLKGITRDGMDYEFTVVLVLDINHHAKVSKDRTRLFSESIPFTIEETTGGLIKSWCDEGNDQPESIIAQIEKASSMDELRAIYEQFPETRERFKQLFTSRKYQLQKHLQNGSIEH